MIKNALKKYENYFLWLIVISCLAFLYFAEKKESNSYFAFQLVLVMTMLITSALIFSRIYKNLHLILNAENSKITNNHFASQLFLFCLIVFFATSFYGLIGFAFVLWIPSCIVLIDLIKIFYNFLKETLKRK